MESRAQIEGFFLGIMRIQFHKGRKEGVSDGSNAYMFVGGRDKKFKSSTLKSLKALMTSLFWSSSDSKGRSDGVEDGRRFMEVPTSYYGRWRRKHSRETDYQTAWRI